MFFLKIKRIIWIFYLSLAITLILIFTIKNEWEKDKGMNEELKFSDTIQSVEIVDGTSGNKVSIEKKAARDEIVTILQESKLISVLNSEETTGYRWRVVIKSYNHLIEVTGPKKVIYDDKDFKFSNNDDYTRFEECITNLYDKYVKNATD